MRTPLGELAELDLSDHDLCFRILSLDKHQVIEGTVVECLFDQYLEGGADGLQFVDVDTAMVRLPDRYDGSASELGAFVWVREPGPGQGRYLDALASVMPTWQVRHGRDAGEFLARRYEPGNTADPGTSARPLQDVASSVWGGSPDTGRFPLVDPSVRDHARSMQSFWGYLVSRYGERLGSRIALPRILLNCGVQPWFRQVRNVDRVYLHRDQLWHLEIKHKFPMHGRGPLSFGINDGELRVIRRLGECGLRSLHTLIIKPDWKPEAGSMYLLTGEATRSRAALIGREITADDVDRALAAAGAQLRRSHNVLWPGQGQFPAVPGHVVSPIREDERQPRCGGRPDRCPHERQQPAGARGPGARTTATHVSDTRSCFRSLTGRRRTRCNDVWRRGQEVTVTGSFQ